MANLARFDGLPEGLKKILLNLEKDKIIELNQGIVLKEKALFLKALNTFKPTKKSEPIINYIKYFFSNFAHLSYLPFEYFTRNLAAYISPGEEKITSISDGKKKDPDNENKGGSRGGPHPPSSLDFGEVESGDTISLDVREIPLLDVPKVVKKPQEELGIWISKQNLDHVKTWNGKYDLRNEKERALFETLENALNIKYNNTGWAYPIGENDGHILKVHVHNNGRGTGTVRIFVARNFDYLTIFQDHYFEIFNFFTPEQHQLFLNEMINEETGDRLYYVELANAIAPKHIVDEKLKGAKLSCYLRDGAGGKTWVDVEIDYSLNDPEIEFKGKETPTRFLREMVIDAAKTTDSMMGMKESLRNDHKNMSERIDVISSDVYSNLITLQTFQKQMNNSINELKKSFKNELNSIENNNNILDLQVLHNIEKLSVKTVQIMKSYNFYNGLGVTIKELQNETKLPRSTLIYHLNKLKDKGLLEIDIIKTGRRGRPYKRYKLP